VLQCIFGAKQVKGIWRKQYNYELYDKLNEPNIVNYIKVKRLAWAGHLMHMNNYKTIKKICNAKPDGVRRVGRPKLRSEDGVNQDMRILEVKNWKRVALNRDEWTKLLKKARAHHGLLSQCISSGTVTFTRFVQKVSGLTTVHEVDKAYRVLTVIVFNIVAFCSYTLRPTLLPLLEAFCELLFRDV